ncbi:MAG: hypothetical protein U5Q44_01625 [Dehalococcoidia bacterium]|nr:hypothetical protein [Dehalococcoidia bacterium]
MLTRGRIAHSPRGGGMARRSSRRSASRSRRSAMRSWALHHARAPVTLLGHRVLDLQPWIGLDEGEGTGGGARLRVVDQELEGCRGSR